MNDFIEIYTKFSDEDLVAESKKLRDALINMEIIPDLIDKINALEFIIQQRQQEEKDCGKN